MKTRVLFDIKSKYGDKMKYKKLYYSIFRHITFLPNFEKEKIFLYKIIINKEELRWGITEHFKLSQLSCSKSGEIPSDVSKFYIKLREVSL